MRESKNQPGLFLVRQKDLGNVLSDILVQIQNKWCCNGVELKVSPVCGTDQFSFYFDSPTDPQAVSELKEWVRKFIRVNF